MGFLAVAAITSGIVMGIINPPGAPSGIMYNIPTIEKYLEVAPKLKERFPMAILVCGVRADGGDSQDPPEEKPKNEQKTPNQADGSRSS